MPLRIGEILVEKKIITAEQLNIAIKEQESTGEAVGEILKKLGFITEYQLLKALAEQQGIPFVDPGELQIDRNVITSVPPKFVWHYKIMPVRLEGGTLTIATSNPFDMWPLDDLETNLGYRVEKVLATSRSIQDAIREYYGVGADTIEEILAAEKPEDKRPACPADGEKEKDIEKMAGKASVIKLVNQILEEAIRDRATDIHIENFRTRLRLRYRIDGILYDTRTSGDIHSLYLAIISRIKVMSGLDIVERRLPQDGRAQIRVDKKEYELRVSCMPTLYGENLVIRILPTTMIFSVQDLGMSPEDRDVLEDIIKKPYGILLVTGPTGSGKTTTLYACLSRLNTKERKIVTIEDPIEYELDGISQTQVNPGIGLTFSRTLRSMLRHDPDIMMVGEIRDFETAEITIQTALTGHLVFSTLHTNDAPSGIARLMDIGVEPYLVASSVEAFMAQRLVRVICDECKEPQEIPEAVLERFGLSCSLPDGKKAVAYRGKGCKACGNTGYRGRTGIYEILRVDGEMKDLILKKVSAGELKEAAVRSGMKTLKQDGWNRVLEGITTPEEVMRVTQV
ncbi:MAG: ATPase, T2SS/T4P/T4SS family [Candidatus Omnitrophota bacterium]